MPRTIEDLVRAAERAIADAESARTTEPASEPPPPPSGGDDPARIEGRPDLPAILLAGDCRFTVVSPRTGVRHTYRIAAPKGEKPGAAPKAKACWKCKGSGSTRWGACFACDGTGDAKPRGADEGIRFVSVLTGSDNTSDYSYTGLVRAVGGPRPVYSHGGPKARVGADAPSARGVAWLLDRVLAGGSVAGQCEIWHQSTCARCGRDLTDPESIARRFGPECWEIVCGA